jgi:hypothetical protein
LKAELRWRSCVNNANTYSTFRDECDEAERITRASIVTTALLQTLANVTVCGTAGCMEYIFGGPLTVTNVFSNALIIGIISYTVYYVSLATRSVWSLFDGRMQQWALPNDTPVK